MLDPRGYPLDTIRLPQLSGRIPVSPSLAVSLTEDDRKVDDVRKVVEFLDKHWPHLIVVGTASPECRQLHADLEKICDVEFTQVRCSLLWTVPAGARAWNGRCWLRDVASPAPCHTADVCTSWRHVYACTRGRIVHPCSVGLLCGLDVGWEAKLPFQHRASFTECERTHAGQS